MNKLIIGSSGFIGSNIIYNSKKKIVCSYYSKKNIIIKKNIKSIKANIFDEVLINKILDKYKINEIINLVSNNDNIINKNTDNYSIWFQNTLSLLRLLEIIRKKKRKIKIIHISSNEQNKKNSTIYSLSKKSSENICKFYRENFNIKVSILRIGSIFGIADSNKKRIVPYIINQIISKKRINIKNPNKKIKFNFADDISKNILNFKNYSKNIHIIKSKYVTTPSNLVKIFQSFIINNHSSTNKIEKKLYEIFIWYKKNNLLK